MNSHDSLRLNRKRKPMEHQKWQNSKIKQTTPDSNKGNKIIII